MRKKQKTFLENSFLILPTYLMNSEQWAEVVIWATRRQGDKTKSTHFIENRWCQKSKLKHFWHQFSQIFRLFFSFALCEFALCFLCLLLKENEIHFYLFFLLLSAWIFDPRLCDWQIYWFSSNEIWRWNPRKKRRKETTSLYDLSLFCVKWYRGSTNLNSVFFFFLNTEWKIIL